MANISRRKAMGYMGSSFLMLSSLQSCCCLVRDWINLPCDPMKDWKEESRDWWKERKAERERQRREDIAAGKRPDIQVPYPFLTCDREPGAHDHVIYQLREFEFNVPGDLYINISNYGNAPTWNCIVEVYETPQNPYEKPFTSFRMTDRLITSVMAGSQREVKARFSATREPGGIGILCFDPFADPAPLSFGQYDRHDTGLSWWKWD